MTTKRMTGKDYRKEYKELTKSLKSLDAHISKRLQEICEIHPDAEVAAGLNGKWFASRPDTIKGLQIATRIKFIENVEKWSADQQKIEQLYIEMPEELKKTMKKLSD